MGFRVAARLHLVTSGLRNQKKAIEPEDCRLSPHEQDWDGALLWAGGPGLRAVVFQRIEDLEIMIQAVMH